MKKDVKNLIARGLMKLPRWSPCDCCNKDIVHERGSFSIKITRRLMEKYSLEVCEECFKQIQDILKKNYIE